MDHRNQKIVLGPLAVDQFLERLQQAAYELGSSALQSLISNFIDVHFSYMASYHGKELWECTCLSSQGPSSGNSGRLPEGFQAQEVLGEGGGEWHLFWKSKDDDASVVGWGSLIETDDIEDLAGLSGLRLFGGLPFAVRREQRVSRPAPFHNSLFFLPRIEWEIAERAVNLKIRIEQEADAEDDDRISGFLNAACDYFRRANIGPALFPKLEGLPVAVRNEPEEPLFCSLVEKAKDEINQGALSKVVLARRKIIHTDLRRLDFRSVLSRLQENREESFVFAFQHPSGESFIGRSPERLLEWHDTTIRVDAIAGTVARHQNSDEDNETAAWLMDSAKDRHEHRFVADFVARKLAAFCFSIKRSAQEKILRLKNVQHLVTSYEAQLRDGINPLDVLMSLHPTPAVGGVPTATALSFLDDHEGMSRRWFAGAIGFTSGHAGDFAIGIRSAFIKDGSLTAYAGAGIVGDSVSEREWQEIEWKFRNFVEIFYPLPESEMLAYAKR
jgi:menaquinone-specific isochorismate synthase